MEILLEVRFQIFFDLDILVMYLYLLVYDNYKDEDNKLLPGWYKVMAMHDEIL